MEASDVPPVLAAKRIHWIYLMIFTTVRFLERVWMEKAHVDPDARLFLHTFR